TPAIAAPTLDAGDLWRRIRHKDELPQDDDDATVRPFVVFAPSVTAKPSTGLSLGLSSSVAFVRGTGDDARVSSASASLKVSMKAQTLGSVRFSMFSPGDRWFVQGDNRLQWTSLNVYGSGLSAPSTGANVKYDWFRIYETAYRRVAPGLFVGGGVNISEHANIRADAPAAEYDAYAAAHGFAADGSTSSGVNASLLYDTRDNAINARRGWLATASYRTFFDGFAGGDSSWQQLNVDVRTYLRLTDDGRHRFAVWMLGDFVTHGNAPYLDLPATSGDLFGRSARGYAEGRYRGPHLLYGEAEYRGDLTASGVVGMVAFLNMTTLDGFATQDRIFRDFAPGAGLGVRLLLDKHSRTNLCADYGFGREGSRGFYLAIQEAF
ncbi:MAG TPA: BamA/TamA family outer membrane protein, partial [Rhodanobacteraceae bacterium]